MSGIIADALGILLACLIIAAVATLLVLFRPSARRRRRRRRHLAQPRIDLFAPVHRDPPGEPDA